MVPEQWAEHVVGSGGDLGEKYCSWMKENLLSPAHTEGPRSKTSSYERGQYNLQHSFVKFTFMVQFTVYHAELDTLHTFYFPIESFHWSFSNVTEGQRGEFLFAQGHTARKQ